ncbi:MAG: ZIP family metal transporter [Candidatus Margulisiibacteriota bacterium]
MNLTWTYALLSVFVTSLMGFAGAVTLPLKGKILNRVIFFLVSFSAGALFGDAFIHLLPEAVEKTGFTTTISLSLLAGIFTLFIVEKIICWRHCHIPTSPSHPHPFAWMNLIGDGFHNFLDGAIIAGSFIASPLLGFTTTIAVILHEIPQEIGDYGVLIHGGFGKVQALLLNFTAQLTAFAGALLILLLNLKIENLTAYLIPFTAGGFIYIAGADLIPELKKETGIRHSFVQLIAITMGIALMLGLLLIG